MPIVLLGLNHKTTPVEIRERFSFTEGAMKRALAALVDGSVIEESMILSTCNRTEIYSSGPSVHEILEKQRNLLATSGNVTFCSFRDYLYESLDREAAKHLFEVACGLDSMILGEGQILGQVKKSFSAAQTLGFTGKVLNKLFDAAIRSGKKARRETAICQGACSISHAVVELAKMIFGDLAHCRTLLVGAGEMSELTVKLLIGAGVKLVIVANRTIERAREIAALHGGQAVTFENLALHLGQADVVISSTAAPHYVLTREKIASTMKARQGRPLFLVDIAVPRDIEPSAGDIANVYLYNIDDLQEVADKNLLRRRDEIFKVKKIINEESASFTCFLQSRDVVPAIKSLREYFEETARAELELIVSKNSLTAHDKQLLKSFTASLLQKLLHGPTIRLKEMAKGSADINTVEKIKQLFSRRDEEE
jgi:glutamyl-tRNA reductase